MDGKMHSDITLYAIKLVDQTISPDEFEELNAVLSSDAEAARHYNQLMMAIGCFQESGQEIFLNNPENGMVFQSDLWQTLLEVEKTAPAIDKPQDESEKVLVRKVSVEKRPLRIFKLLAFAAAIVLFLLIPFILPSRSDFATVTRTLDARWGTEQILTGAGLQAGSFELTQGFAELVTAKGAKVILEGPVRFMLLEENEVFLEAGKISAVVPPQAEGFTIRTSDMRVVDRGTEFGVNVFPAGMAEVDVFKGKVQVALNQSAGGGQFTQDLSQGSAVRVDSQRSRILPISSSRDRYTVTWNEVLDRVEVSGQIRYLRTPPKELKMDAFESDQAMFLVQERENVALTADLEVYAFGDRFQRQISIDQLSKSAVSTESVVNSYLLHADTTDKEYDRAQGETRTFKGEIRFNRPVVGLIFETDRLVETDRMLGCPGVTYGTSEISRGIAGEEAASYTDYFQLSEDGRTLRVEITLRNIDQIRILTSD